MVILYYILIINALIAFKLWWDTRAKRKGRIISHILSAAIDTTLYTLAAIYFFGWDAGGVAFIALGYRWIVFDTVFAKINWNTWDYHGTSSGIDLFLIKLREGTPFKILKWQVSIRLGRWHFIVKLIPIIIGILIICYNYEKTLQ